MDKKQKPTLTLLSGKKTLDIEAITKLFKKLTGREPTPEDLAESKKILEEKESKVPRSN